MRKLFLLSMLAILIGLLPEPARTTTPEPEPAPIVFPIVPPVPLPPVPPPPTPGRPISLPGGVWYVITSAQPFLVVASPPGVVSVVKESGPLKLLGRFVDDPDKVQCRNFTAKNIAIVTAIKTGTVELLAWPVGTTDEGKVIRSLIDANVGPLPPPVPPVPPGPVPPTPGPAPIPGDGLRVLIIYETSEMSKMTRGQQGIITSQLVRAYLKAKCAPDPTAGDGKAYRMWDKDAPTDGESTSWQMAMKRPRASVPWLIVSNPAKGGGFEGPLPDGDVAFLAVVKQYE